MRIFSYRNKRRARTALIILGAVLLALLIFCGARFIYLQRFLVYTPDGVQLDYSQDLEATRPEADPDDPAAFPVEVVTEAEGIPVVSPADGPLAPLTGFHVTTAMFQNVPAVEAALADQGSVDALLLDMKSIYGNFYYNSSIPGAYEASVDVAAIEALISRLSQTQTYLIARVPAFSDNNFALDNQSCGLPLSSGALWMDSNGCYWLDPLDPLVQEYLVSIARELSALGFHEVVFDQFRIPDSENIVYDREMTRDQAAAQAAQDICDSLAGDAIRVSFGTESAAVAAHAQRVYLTAGDGGSVAALVAAVQESLEDPAAQITFLTASRDTRFDGYGILRPLIEEETP